MPRVSFSLIAIPADRAQEADDAFEWIGRMDDGEVSVAAERAALTALGDELSRSFPGTDGDEPIVSLLPGRVEIEIAWTTIEAVAPTVLDMATRYGLDVFDPQSGHVYHVGDEPPPAEHWARASTPFQDVIAAIERGGPEFNGPDQADAISAELATLVLLEVTASVAESAAKLPPPSLRSLDAIHLATAMTVGDELEAIVTYDGRLANVAASLGLSVVAPG